MKESPKRVEKLTVKVLFEHHQTCFKSVLGLSRFQFFSSYFNLLFDGSIDCLRLWRIRVKEEKVLGIDIECFSPSTTSFILILSPESNKTPTKEQVTISLHENCLLQPTISCNKDDDDQDLEHKVC